MRIPLQAEVTINWPGTHVNGAFAKVVGFRHDPAVTGWGIYIVYVPKLNATLNLSISRLSPLDELVQAGIFDQRRHRNETVSWRRLWHSINWWPTMPNLALWNTGISWDQEHRRNQ